MVKDEVEDKKSKLPSENKIKPINYVFISHVPLG